MPNVIISGRGTATSTGVNVFYTISQRDVGNGVLAAYTKANISVSLSSSNVLRVIVRSYPTDHFGEPDYLKGEFICTETADGEIGICPGSVRFSIDVEKIDGSYELLEITGTDTVTFWTSVSAVTAISINNNNPETINKNQTAGIRWAGAQAGVNNPIHHYNIVRYKKSGSSFVFDKNVATDKQDSDQPINDSGDFELNQQYRYYIVTYGYGVVGSIPDSASSGDTGVFALLNVVGYRIRFLNGSTVLQDGYVDSGVVPSYTGSTPTKASTAQYTFEFSGWSPTIYAANKDQDYLAQFNSYLRSYTITWKNYDGTVLQSGTVAYGATPVYSGATPTKPPTSEYIYTFSGWNPTVTTVTEAQTYTAQFTQTQIDHYYVSFKKNDSTGSTRAEGTMADTSAVLGADFVIPSNQYSRYGYTFSGWNTSADGSGTSYRDGQTVFDGLSSVKDVTVPLYAIWEAKLVTIHFDMNDDNDPEHPTHSPATQLGDITRTFDQQYGVIPSPAERRGYNFIDWGITAEHTDPDTHVDANDYIRSEQITLYAHWELIESARLTFNTNGGGLIPDRFITVEDDYPYQVRDKCFKQNFTFVGWVFGEAGTNPTWPYVIAEWPGEDSVTALYAKYSVSTISFTPKIGEAGEENGYYGVPVDSLDSQLSYRFRFEVVGDRTTTPVYQNPETGSFTLNGTWIWSYETEIMTTEELAVAMEDVWLTKDIWRAIVEHSEGTLHCYFDTYENGSIQATVETYNVFALSDDVGLYYDKTNHQDVQLYEGVTSIKNLDLYCVEDDYTRRFVGNGKSTPMIKVICHSKDGDGNEHLYGAVPKRIVAKIEYGTESYSQTYEFGTLPYTDSEMSYESGEMQITTAPFPSIENDITSAVLKLRIYDSRHYVS